MSQRPDEFDQAAVIDRALFESAAVLTAGISAFHQLSPAEQMMRGEETAPESEAWALRAEIFNGFLEYAFADGPAPWDVRIRLDGFLHAVDPAQWAAVKPEMAWWGADREPLERVLSKYRARLNETPLSRGALCEWYRALEAEPAREVVVSMLATLARLVTAEGLHWRKIVAQAFALAKALRPELLGGMSLHDMALLCGDKGRATPQSRIKRCVNAPMEAASGRPALLHFQKSADAAEKYRVAQLGNRNRFLAARKKRKK